MMDAFDALQLAVMAVYLALLIGRTVQLRRMCGVKPFALGSGKTGFPALLEWIFFPALILWWAESASYALHAPFRIFPAPFDTRLLEGFAWKAAGAALLLCACGLFAWALISFGVSWRAGIDKRHPGPLVTEGAFALSRNPIFLSIALYFIGAFPLNRSAFFLAAAIPAAAGSHYQILREEQYLLRQSGEAYHAYRRATPWYFGRTRHERIIHNRRVSDGR